MRLSLKEQSAVLDHERLDTAMKLCFEALNGHSKGKGLLGHSG